MDLSPVIQFIIFTFSDKSLVLKGNNNFQTSLPYTRDRYLVKCKKSPGETESDKETDEHLNKKMKNDAEQAGFEHTAEPGQSNNQQCGQCEGMDNGMSPTPNDDVPVFVLSTEDQDDVIDVLAQPTDLSDSNRTSTKKPFKDGPHGEWIVLKCNIISNISDAYLIISMFITIIMYQKCSKQEILC